MWTSTWMSRMNRSVPRFRDSKTSIHVRPTACWWSTMAPRGPHIRPAAKTSRNLMQYLRYVVADFPSGYHLARMSTTRKTHIVLQHEVAQSEGLRAAQPLCFPGGNMG
ncbi:hypothetical protein M3J09_007100 [Ascochyta lentis]